jgi:tRNA(fMet)-specific endonuclease VapC
LNGDAAIVARVLALPEVVLPMVVVGELLFGAENFGWLKLLSCEF